MRCDGIGCASEQKTTDGWSTIAYASRYLNTCRNKNSVNELELLAVVFTLIFLNTTDTLDALHQASIIKHWLAHYNAKKLLYLPK